MGTQTHTGKTRGEGEGRDGGDASTSQAAAGRETGLEQILPPAARGSHLLSVRGGGGRDSSPLICETTHGGGTLAQLREAASFKPKQQAW